MNVTVTERTLDRLRPGESAIVAELVGDETTVRRLGDLGLWPGVAVTMVRRAPFGDPTLYRLHGYRLALRRVEAATVRMRAAGPPTP